MAHTESDQAYRAARRRVVRSLHPDRGGDTATFVAAMQAIEQRSAQSPGERPQVVATGHTRMRRGVKAGGRALRAARALLPRGWPGARRYIQL